MEFCRRKWGWYWTLYSDHCFKIKLLYFRKDKFCSLQRHFKREEMWCFLFGGGQLNLSHDSQIMTSGAAAFIPARMWHQFTAYKNTLVLEIQTGICEESDIERVGQ